MSIKTAPAKLSYSLAEAVTATGLSRSYWTRAIASGALPARRSGEDSDGNPSGSYVILATDLEAFLGALKDA